MLYFSFGKTEIFCAPTLPALFRHQHSLGLSLRSPEPRRHAVPHFPVPGRSLLTPVFSVFTSFPNTFPSHRPIPLCFYFTWLLTSVDREEKKILSPSVALGYHVMCLQQHVLDSYQCILLRGCFSVWWYRELKVSVWNRHHLPAVFKELELNWWNCV